MSYQRVIPRDFFNEAKLLKCMGVLQLYIDANNTPEGITIEIKETGAPFIIEKDETSGDIYITNYECKVNGNIVRFESNLNSKAEYPLSCYFQDSIFSVFTDLGDFDNEFIEAFRSPQ